MVKIAVFNYALANLLFIIFFSIYTALYLTVSSVFLVVAVAFYMVDRGF